MALYNWTRMGYRSCIPDRKTRKKKDTSSSQSPTLWPQAIPVSPLHFPSLVGSVIFRSLSFTRRWVGGGLVSFVTQRQPGSVHNPPVQSVCGLAFLPSHGTSYCAKNIGCKPNPWSRPSHLLTHAVSKTWAVCFSHFDLAAQTKVTLR